MKKTIFLMAVAAIVAVAVAACSGNKSETSDNNQEASEVVESVKGLDYDKLKALTKQDKLEAKDYDFLLDQCEEVVKMTKGKTQEELDAMSKEEDFFGAMVVIGLGLEGGVKSGQMSEKQIARYKELEAQMPQ